LEAAKVLRDLGGLKTEKRDILVSKPIALRTLEGQAFLQVLSRHRSFNHHT
jgi:hypothetical protein